MDAQTNNVIWDLIFFLVLATSVITAFVTAVKIISPIYGVWARHKEGQADLAKATNEQQVQVAKAQGRLNAAELNKKAAIVEAEAVSAQIEKIGATLTVHDLYLRWQWIKMMEERDGSTIYVPTEANLPILEARRKPQ